MRRALLLLAVVVLALIACGARGPTAPPRALLCPGVVDTVRLTVGDSTYLELLRRCGIPVPGGRG